MGRQAKFDREAILDAALKLAAERGMSRVSMQGVAAMLGAPSGSLYHRYASRDHLLGDLWLHVVDDFQSGLFEALDHEDPREALRGGARHVVAWSRRHPEAARVLLLFSASDFRGGAWPDDIRDATKASAERLATALRGIERRLHASTREHRRRVRACLIDVPYGIVRSRLRDGDSLAAADEDIVDEIVACMLERVSPAGR